MHLIASCQAYFRLGKAIFPSKWLENDDLEQPVLCWPGGRHPAMVLGLATKDLLLLIFKDRSSPADGFKNYFLSCPVVTFGCVESLHLGCDIFMKLGDMQDFFMAIELLNHFTQGGVREGLMIDYPCVIMRGDRITSLFFS